MTDHADWIKYLHNVSVNMAIMYITGISLKGSFFIGNVSESFLPSSWWLVLKYFLFHHLCHLMSFTMIHFLLYGVFTRSC